MVKRLRLNEHKAELANDLIIIIKNGELSPPFFFLLAFLDVYPVGIEPAAVGLGVGLDTYETELRTNPFALTHGELAAAIGPFLAVQAVGETDHGFAAMSHTGLGVGDGEAEVDVFMDAGLVVNLILGGRLQRGNELLVLGLAAVGILAGKQQELEFFTDATDDQCLIVEAHHDETAHLSVGLRGEANLRGGHEFVGRGLLQQHVGHEPKVGFWLLAISNWLFIRVDTHGAEGGGDAELLVVVGLPLPLLTNGGAVELVTLLWVGY